MKTRLIVCLPLLALMSCNSSSEDNCDREGCDAVGTPAEGYSIATGIAGAVGWASDVIQNGCGECPFGSGEIWIFDAPHVFGSASEIESYLETNDEHSKVPVDAEYEHALSEGTYLICSDDVDGFTIKCASIEIADGEVFTVNILYVFGPTDLKLFEPGKDEESLTGVYDVQLPWNQEP